LAPDWSQRSVACYYCPAEFFRHLGSAALSFPKGKMHRAFKKKVTISVVLLFLELWTYEAA
jgi:hypothetical protein